MTQEMVPGIGTNVRIPYNQELMPYHEEVARLVCENTPNKGIVLDVGCGVGHTLIECQRRNPSLKLVAADIDPACLAITQKRVELHQALQVTPTLDELLSMDLKVDTVIMSHVLEHMHRPLDTLLGIMGLCRPDGIAVLAVPNPVRLQVFVGNIFRWHYVNRGHVYAWDRSHWMNFLENIANLNVVCYSQDFFPLPLRARFGVIRLLERRLASVLPWLAFSNIAVVRKQGGR